MVKLNRMLHVSNYYLVLVLIHASYLSLRHEHHPKVDNYLSSVADVDAHSNGSLMNLIDNLYET